MHVEALARRCLEHLWFPLRRCAPLIRPARSLGGIYRSDKFMTTATVAPNAWAISRAGSQASPGDGFIACQASFRHSPDGSRFGEPSVYDSTCLEHCNRPVQGRKVLQKIAVQNHEVGKLAFRDCANFVDDP